MLQFLMIRTFRYEALRPPYGKNQGKSLNLRWLKRIRAILADFGQQTARFWAVDVSGNWRIVFRFQDNELHDVDLLDYH
jgi:hypothetical protein